MIVRNGRGEVQEHGPHRVISVSGMKIAAGYGEEASGGWDRNMDFLFARPERPVRAEKSKVAYEDRTATERQRRYRARRRAHVNAVAAAGARRRRAARAATAA